MRTLLVEGIPWSVKVFPNMMGGAPPIRSSSQGLNRTLHPWDSSNSDPLPPHGSVPPGPPATDTRRNLPYCWSQPGPKRAPWGPLSPVRPFHAVHKPVKPTGCPAMGCSYWTRVPYSGGTSPSYATCCHTLTTQLLVGSQGGAFKGKQLPRSGQH